MSELRTRLARAHDAQWRDPGEAIASAPIAISDRRILHGRASGAWWDFLDEAGITLLVTREYEHLLMALTMLNGRPEISYLPLPHPAGIAVDSSRATVVVASTRNPNQVFELKPADGFLERGDVRPPLLDFAPLVPTRSSIHPGALYLHDLAFVGGKLFANSVGQNAVVRLERDESRVAWWPRCVERAGVPDLTRNYLQLNSIAAGDTLESSFFSASSDTMSHRRPGHRNFPVDRKGVVFSGMTREVVARGLTRPHSARLHRSSLWVDDAGYGELVVVRDGGVETIARLPGWTRGLAFVQGVAVVGTSRVLPRFRQYAPGLDADACRCGLHAVDLDTGRVVGSYVWPLGDQIFAVDSIPRGVSAGLPYSLRRGSDVVRRLFYSFDSTAKERGRT